MCIGIVILIVVSLLALLSVLHWFEQMVEAVDNGWWNKVTMLVIVPPSVWFFPSRIVSGRPTAVPHHEPVRGFGKVPLTPSESATKPDQPPPGTPKEFLEMPKIPPPKPKGTRAGPDPELMEKLRKKMREQGMLGDE